MIKVRVTSTLMPEIFTEGEPGIFVRVSKGIPEGARLAHVSFNPMSEYWEFYFDHPDYCGKDYDFMVVMESKIIATNDQHTPKTSQK